MKNLFMLLLAGIAILSIVVLVFLQKYGDRLIQHYKTRAVKTGKKKVRKDKLYQVLANKPIIGNYLKWVRAYLFISESADEISLRNKSVFLGLSSIVISVITFITLMRLYQFSLYLTLAFGLGCIYLNSVIIKSFVGSVDIKLLYALIEYLGDVKHQYHKTSMVDEAIKKANERAKNEMLTQGMKIYEVITSSECEKNLKTYYDNCSNKFLKIFSGFSHLVIEYGDKKIDGVSLYIKNLNYIIEEIHIEIIKKKQLSYWLRGLNAVTLFPLFLPPLIEKLLNSGFPIMRDFFESSTAFYIKCIIFVISALCYVFVAQIQKNEYKMKEYRKSGLISRLIDLKPVKSFLSTSMPKPESSSYKNTFSLLEEAGSILTMEEVFLRRYITGVTMFIVVVGFFAASHSVAMQKVLNNPVYGIANPNFFKMVGKISVEDEKQRKDINSFDKYVLDQINTVKSSLSTDELKRRIAEEILNLNHKGEDPELTTQRILAKMEATKGQHVLWWEVIIALVVGFAASYIPILILAFQGSLRKVDMEDEVFQFHTIIILLMHHDRVDTQIIIEWMYQFSNIFKVPLERCLYNFHDSEAALKMLKSDVKFKPFINIIENLEMATSGDISIIAAFDSLELERTFYKENRKEVNKQTVNKKIEYGQMIGFIPFYVVLFLYVALPMIYTGFTAFETMKTQLLQK